jgi:signal transduction histidine kinase
LLTGVLLVLVAGFLYAPLLAYFQRLVDRLFFRTAVNRQQMTVGFARQVAATLDLGEVARALCSLLAEALKPRSVALYLANDQGVPILFGMYDGAFRTARWPEGSGLPAEVARADWRAATQPFRCRLTAPLGRPGVELREGDEALVVPIVRQVETLGILVLQPKRADEPYEEDELGFAETAAAHSAVALQNARAVARLEQLRSLTHQTLEGLTAGVFLVNRREELVEWNRAAKNIWDAGHPGREWPGSLPEMEAAEPAIGRILREAVNNGQHRANVEVRLGGSRPLNLLVSVSGLGTEGDRAGLLVLLHDITDYKELEALARRREGLAQVGEMITSINHEIGNIIQPVHTQVRRLEDLSLPHPTIQEAVPVLRERLAALDRLLANLKDLARPIELRVLPVDVQSLVESVIRDLKDEALSAGVCFHVSVAPAGRACLADGHWLRQVLYNLLRNAAEATAGRRPGEVGVHACAEGKDFHLTVYDNGPGLDPAVQGKLFEPFVSTKGRAGTGLGLSICRKVIELHGGSIRAGNRRNGGACFTVVLPAAHCRQAGTQPVSASLDR